MEKNFLASDSIMELEFITESENTSHSHENFELLYLISGSLCVEVEEEEFYMNPRDMLVVNRNKKHSCRGDSDVFIARFVISHNKLRDLLEQEVILFWCNSVVDKNEAYDELRVIITQIFNQHQRNDSRGYIYLKSLYYQMLHVLTSNFLLTSSDIRFQAEKSRTDERMQEIMRYLRVNFRRNISLKDLAEKMHLSSAYLSKYIKKMCGISYMELINSVRLDYSMEELVYTDTSIMKIAMDCGFASVAAYNKVFREKYSNTPSEFRKAVKKKNLEKQMTEERQLIIRKRVQTYLEEIDQKKKSCDRNEIQVVIPGKKETDKSWKFTGNKMINAGTVLNLNNSSFRKQILFLKKNLGIQYVRFWDIYAPELYIDIHAPKGKIHFGRLDEAVDFLVKNDLKPYMELGFKPLRILKNTRQALVEIPRNMEFDSGQEMRDFFGEFIEHFVRRYGAEEVQTWYFEYWKKETLEFDRNLKFQYQPMSEAYEREYFQSFDVIAGVFRKVLAGVRIGGGGFSLQHYGEEGFKNILKWWHQSEQLPDFLSFNCYPYQMQREDNIFFEKKSTDLYFVRHNLELIRKVAEREGFPKTEIHISEYSLTLSNRNAINDSCAKGAFLVQTALSCQDQADILGYWIAFDSYADFNDAQQFLFGGCGLLTKTGVPKPSYYAFEFLHHLHGKVYASGKNYICTGTGRDSFRILCHNFTGFNYNYYLTDEDKVLIQNIPGMLENNDSLTIKVRIENARNGTYLIKTSRVNQMHGSVQDEWMRLNQETELNMREQEYLERISLPELQIKRKETGKDALEVELLLEPNEICYIHMIFAGS